MIWRAPFLGVKMDIYTQQQLHALQAQLGAVQLQNADFVQKIAFLEQVARGGSQFQLPLQWKAGVLQKPGKEPHPFKNVVYTIPQQSDTSFGETTTEGIGSFSVDRSAETYLERITAAIYQYEAAQGAEGVVLNRYRPIASNRICSPTASGCESLLDFEFQIFFGNDESLMQDNWLPSTLLNGDKEDGMGLLVQKEITEYETIEVRARPLAAAGAGNKFRLGFTFHQYKMVRRRTS
jgi:hypothetical protein